MKEAATRRGDFMRSLAVLVATLALAGCAAQPFGYSGDPFPGFWWGLLHGAISPFSLIGSFFDPTIRAYATPNTGWWYDFGFVIGLGLLFGGGASANPN
jgi:hypothetical protein